MGGRGVPAYSPPDEEDLVVQTVTTRPAKLGRPFTRWSLRKLADHLACRPGPGLRIGRESLRTLLHRHHIIFQRTMTWKDSPDPARDTKLDRIEHVMEHFPDRIFAFDEFDPWGIRPTAATNTLSPSEGPNPGASAPTVPVVATAKKKGITPISGGAEMEEWGGQEEDADHGV